MAVFIALKSGRAVAFWAEWQLLLAPQHLVVATRSRAQAAELSVASSPPRAAGSSGPELAAAQPCREQGLRWGRGRPGLFRSDGAAQSWCSSKKRFLPLCCSPGPSGCAGLCYAALASNGVSGHFADDTRSLLGLMQRN